jgi:large subunit ribosomal protein L18
MDRKDKIQKQAKRKRRVRSKVVGTKKRPRLSVFRSHKYIYGQIIDDASGKTLISVSQSQVKGKNDKKTKTEMAFAVGELLAKKAKTKKIKNVAYDRGAYKYHGRVKALADGARKGGLKF